jgi:hypothetical protein
MNIELNVPEYNPSEGFRFLWDDEFEIAIAIDTDCVVIRANEAGLRSLARHLLALAQRQVPSGYHLHLDESNSLEENSHSLIIEKCG